LPRPRQRAERSGRKRPFDDVAREVHCHSKVRWHARVPIDRGGTGQAALP
jgi:hypothetical protein